MTTAMDTTPDAQSPPEIGSTLGTEGTLESQTTTGAESSTNTQSSQRAETSPELGRRQVSLEIRIALEVAYQDLVQAMSSTLCEMPFKIDLLPDSHPLPSGLNVVVENHVISLTKGTLRKAFAIAREEFFAKVINISHFQYQKDVIYASTVILLQAPEHLTAANARKRIIMAWEKESEKRGILGVLMDLCLLDSILMSALSKHAKSPTLWAHRRWLMQRIPPSDPLLPEGQPASYPLIKEREISDVALMAAHNHPCNYYAWDYMRWWIETNPELLATFGQHAPTNSTTKVAGIGLPTLVKTIQQWCLKHPSDTSGWSFLLWLLTVPGTWSLGHLHLQGPFDETCQAILDSVACLKLRNEALWVFLRTIMSAEAIHASLRRAFDAEAQSIWKSGLERPRSKTMAKAAVQWHGRHREQAPLRRESGETSDVGIWLV